ncbi:PH domain-containing protein [Cellulomonas marina]|uniref:Putative membrane protein n=1 Tax=Cellulomonas marina TaxID=988821 RepID=A0A1I0WP07_9CELL|nr:PH domain-containing protein [Cellulomonas marina]GIG27743.1 membrane protein [Cellulomonas marina]SFA89723.1 putative membrane protein [Cellulomonas marina]
MSAAPDPTTPDPTTPDSVTSDLATPDLPSPAPDGPVAPVTPEAVGEEAYAWRRMHPVTPVVRGWRVVVGVLAVAVFQLDSFVDLVVELGARAWLVGLGLLLVVGVIGFASSVLAWRMTRFAVTDEAVHLRQGVVFRQQRQARLDRLQAVDLVQPLLARLLGLAELRLDVAGGTGSSVALAFLREAEAEDLRVELLALAAGRQRPGTGPLPADAPLARTLTTGDEGAPPAVGPAGTQDRPHGGTSHGAHDGTDAPAPAVPAAAPVGVGDGRFTASPEQQVYEVPAGRVLLSVVRSSALVWPLVAVAGVTVPAVLFGEPGGFFVLFPAVFGALGFVWSRVNNGIGFRAATSPDGIRLRHGLTEQRAQTVPPGRVQAVRLTQTPLWRGPDWWRVEMNVAGYGGGGGGESTSSETVLLPVGPRDEAVTAVWLVLPDLGVADPRALLDTLLSADPTAREGAITSPRPARRLDPVAWRRRAAVVTDRALLARRGRFTRVLEVVPHERTQSLGVEQGPLQRRLGLASVVLHSTPGPVSPRVDHLAAADAAALLDELSVRARAARAGAAPEQWLRDVRTAP